jgi:hypothetical protein
MSQYLTEDQLRLFVDAIKSDKNMNPVIFTTQPTDLELRIRKDVMDAMEELKSFEDEFEDETEIYFNNLLNKVIGRLKLLWGE